MSEQTIGEKEFYREKKLIEKNICVLTWDIRNAKKKYNEAKRDFKKVQRTLGRLEERLLNWETKLRELTDGT